MNSRKKKQNKIIKLIDTWVFGLGQGGGLFFMPVKLHDFFF
jgi:hypothetical protein